MPKDNFEEMISDFDGFMRDRGYVRSKEWADVKHVSLSRPNAMINDGKISGLNYFKAGHVHYISLERDGYKKYGEEFKAILEDFEGYMRDHGYIRTSEYAEENFQSPVTVRNWYQRNILIFPDVIKIGEVYYMRKDVDIVSKFKPRGPKSGRRVK